MSDVTDGAVLTLVLPLALLVLVLVAWAFSRPDSRRRWLGAAGPDRADGRPNSEA